MKILLLAKKLQKLEAAKFHGGRHHGETFREVLSNFCDLEYHSDSLELVPKLIEEFNPDVLLVHFRGLEGHLDLSNIKIPTVYLSVDYAGSSIKSIHREDQRLRNDCFDLIINPCFQSIEILRAKQLARKIKFLPLSIDLSICYNMELPRNIDVAAIFAHKSHLYPNRKKVLETLRTMPINSFLRSRQSLADYIKIINSSKIFASANPTTCNVTRKYHEVMSCGTLLITDRPDEFNLLGYENGKHLILYDTMQDMREKILYLLKHKKERKKISEAGMRFARKHFSHEAYAQQLINLLEKEL